MPFRWYNNVLETKYSKGYLHWVQLSILIHALRRVAKAYHAFALQLYGKEKENLHTISFSVRISFDSLPCNLVLSKKVQTNTYQVKRKGRIFFFWLLWWYLQCSCLCKLPPLITVHSSISIKWHPRKPEYFWSGLLCRYLFGSATISLMKRNLPDWQNPILH